MSGIALYFLLKLTTIGYALYYMGGVMIAFIETVASITLVKCDYEDVKWWPVFKVFRPKTCVVVGTLFVLVAVMLPTSKQMAIIYIVPKVANNQMVQKIPQKILLLSEEWFEELLPENNIDGEKTTDNSASTQSEKTSD